MTTPASPHPQPPAYRADIDGLRGIAVLSVMLFHAGVPGFGGGFVGVDVFFVISGFLITQLILADCEAGRFSFRRFYERRVRRLLPALLLVMGASFVAGLFVLSPGEMRDFSVSAIAAVTFVSNVYFWRTSGYFEQAAELKPLLHTWSLAIEAQFYIAFPILLLALRRYGHRVLLTGLIVALVVSLLVAQGLVTRKPVAAFFSLPTRAWELALGAVLAVLLENKASRWAAPAKPDALAFLGLGLIAISVVAFNARTAVPGFPALIPTMGAGLVILAGRDSRIVSRLLTWKPLLILGLASYSAYLWHHPLLAFGRIASGGSLDPKLALALLGLSILLALLT